MLAIQEKDYKYYFGSGGWFGSPNNSSYLHSRSFNQKKSKKRNAIVFWKADKRNKSKAKASVDREKKNQNFWVRKHLSCLP